MKTNRPNLPTFEKIISQSETTWPSFLFGQIYCVLQIWFKVADEIALQSSNNMNEQKSLSSVHTCWIFYEELIWRIYLELEIEKERQNTTAILVVKCSSHERIFVSWKIGRALCTKEVQQRSQTSNDAWWEPKSVFRSKTLIQKFFFLSKKRLKHKSRADEDWQSVLLTPIWLKVSPTGSELKVWMKHFAYILSSSVEESSSWCNKGLLQTDKYASLTFLQISKYCFNIWNLKV